MSRRLLGNSIWNFSGAVLPAVVMLVTVPIIVHRLGAVDYGLLALITSIVGYFTLIDFNVTTGTVKFVAEFHSVGRRKELNQSITFGLVVYLAAGTIGAVLIYAFAKPLVNHVFNVPEASRAMAEELLRLAALGFLFTQLQAYMMSIPQALQRYDIGARFEIAFGVLVPLITVAVLLMGFGLFEVVLVRVIAAALNVAGLAVFCRHLLPDFHWDIPKRDLARNMLGFSGYTFMSRFAVTTYYHADTLIIGALIGMAPLAVFVLAFTLAGRVLNTTFRLVQVMLPAASAWQARGEISQLRATYLYYSRYYFFINGYFATALIVFAPEILRLWIGPEYSEGGALVMRLIAISVVFDSLTNLPSLLNDGLGHPKVNGLLVLGRTILGLLLAYVLTLGLGINGAAAAHAITFGVYAAALLVYSHGRTVPVPLGEVIKQGYVTVLWVAVATGAVIWWIKDFHSPTFPWLVVSGLAFTMLYMALGAMFVLTVDDRRRIARLLQVWRTLPKD